MINLKESPALLSMSVLIKIFKQFPNKNFVYSGNVKNDILMPWISVYIVTKKGLITLSLDKTLHVINKALKNGIKRYLKGKSVKPVFRRFN